MSWLPVHEMNVHRRIWSSIDMLLVEGDLPARSCAS